MDIANAKDIKVEIKKIIRQLDFSHVDSKRIVCMRSTGSTSKARARIWSFPKIWQKALNLPAYYIIEVISEKFDKLSAADKQKTLIHELLHIPKNFSGSLLPHKTHFSRIDWRRIESLFNKLAHKRN